MEDLGMVITISSTPKTRSPGFSKTLAMGPQNSNFPKKGQKPPNVSKISILRRKIGGTGAFMPFRHKWAHPPTPLRGGSRRGPSPKNPKTQKKGPQPPRIFAKQRENKGAPLNSRGGFGNPKNHPRLREKRPYFLLSRIWVFEILWNLKIPKKKLKLRRK